MVEGRGMLRGKDASRFPRLIALSLRQPIEEGYGTSFVLILGGLVSDDSGEEGRGRWERGLLFIGDSECGGRTSSFNCTR